MFGGFNIGSLFSAIAAPLISSLIGNALQRAMAPRAPRQNMLQQQPLPTLPTSGATPWSTPVSARTTPGIESPASPILANQGPSGQVNPSAGLGNLSIEEQILRAARGNSGGMGIGGV